METLISSMIASGRSVNRPPHILLLMTYYSCLPLILAPANMPCAIAGATEALNSRI
jgi:hypothetical protein